MINDPISQHSQNESDDGADHQTEYFPGRVQNDDTDQNAHIHPQFLASESILRILHRTSFSVGYTLTQSQRVVIARMNEWRVKQNDHPAGWSYTTNVVDAALSVSFDIALA